MTIETNQMKSKAPIAKANGFFCVTQSRALIVKAFTQRGDL
jgi:hypothetical protein